MLELLIFKCNWSGFFELNVAPTLLPKALSLILICLKETLAFKTKAVIFSISKKPVLSIKRMEIKKNFTKTGSMIQIAQKAAKI